MGIEAVRGVGGCFGRIGRLFADKGCWGMRGSCAGMRCGGGCGAGREHDDWGIGEIDWLAWVRGQTRSGGVGRNVRFGA